jgi:hypothetical protein
MMAVAEATRGWAAVALFYSAHQLMHAVLDGESVLSNELRHPESHAGPEGTSGLVSRLYRPIAVQYLSLFGTGKAVRYFGQQVSQADYDDLRQCDYEAVRTWAARRLTDHGRTQLPEFLS